MEMQFDPAEHPHRRRNALTGDWVLVSPHRTKRPWQGQHERVAAERRPAYDPQCYLCPGNERAGGLTNPPYDSTFVFTNDFAALMPNAPAVGHADGDLLAAEAVAGTCRVICFSPRHDLSLPELELPAIRGVVDLWAAQVAELRETYAWVQVFENKGAVMGCSNPHPHGQIWASSSLPNEILKEDQHQRDYLAKHGQPLLGDYLAAELASGERLVVESAHWVGLVPWWAVWPFEVLLLPKQQVTHLPELSEDQRHSLSKIMRELLSRYDNLFETSFPYSMGWHGAPATEGDQSHWWLHAHYYPPLLRSATVKKFMVGYEMLAEAQRDLTPEHAAARLCEQDPLHYRWRG